MEELEQKLSYGSDQVRFGASERARMMEGNPGQRLGQMEQRICSNSTDEKLRALDQEILESNEKLRKLGRRKGVVGNRHIQIGQAKIGPADKPGRGRLYNAAASRPINKVNEGVARMRFRAATQEDYVKKHSRQRRLENRSARRGRLLFRAAESLGSGSMEADEGDAFLDAAKAGRKGARLAYAGARRLAHGLLEANSVYKRFDAEMQRNKRLQAERRRLNASLEENAGGGKRRQETPKKEGSSRP